MKNLRLVGKLLGISLLVLGFSSSCKKDKDSNKCLTCTYEGETIKFCDDDPLLKGWEDEFDSWEDAYNYLKGELEDYGFDCD